MEGFASFRVSRAARGVLGGVGEPRLGRGRFGRSERIGVLMERGEPGNATDRPEGAEVEASTPDRELTPRPPFLELVACDDALRERLRFPLRRGKTTIGRGSNCDITISQDSVAGLQAEIIYENSEFALRQRGAVSSTTLNGIEVTADTFLLDGDKIGISGVTTLKAVLGEFDALEGEASTPAAAEEGSYSLVVNDVGTPASEGVASLADLEATQVVDRDAPERAASEALESTRVVTPAASNENVELAGGGEGSSGRVVASPSSENRLHSTAPVTQSAPPVSLICVAGSLEGEVFRVGPGECQLGREGRDLVLPDPLRRISRHHATISVHSAGLTVKANPAIRARNPTAVNGKAIDKSPLYDGDEISMGDCRFVIRLT